MAAGKDAIVPLKQQVDLALVGNGVVQNVLVVRHGTANCYGAGTRSLVA